MKRLLTIVFLLTLLTACSPSTAPVESNAAPVEERPAAKAEQATAAPTSEPAPLPSPTTTPFEPRVPGEPLNIELESITAENLTQLTRLVNLGDEFQPYLIGINAQRLVVYDGGYHVYDGEISEIDLMNPVFDFKPEGSSRYAYDDETASIFLYSIGDLVYSLKNVEKPDQPEIEVRLLDASQKVKELYDETSGQVSIDTMDVSKDGVLAVFVVSDGRIPEFFRKYQISVVQTADSTEVFQVEGKDIFFSPDGSLMGVFLDKSITLFDTTTWKRVTDFTVDGNWRFKFSPDSQLMALGRGKSLEIYRRSDRKLIRVIDVPEAETNGMVFRFTPDSQKIGVLVPGGALDIWNIDDGSKLQSPDAGLSGLSLVQLDNDGGFTPFEFTAKNMKAYQGGVQTIRFNLDSSALSWKTHIGNNINELCRYTLANGELTCERFERNLNNPSAHELRELGDDGEFYTAIYYPDGSFAIHKGTTTEGERLFTIKASPMAALFQITRFTINTEQKIFSVDIFDYQTQKTKTLAYNYETGDSVPTGNRLSFSQDGKLQAFERFDGSQKVVLSNEKSTELGLQPGSYYQGYKNWRIDIVDTASQETVGSISLTDIVTKARWFSDAFLNTVKFTPDGNSLVYLWQDSETSTSTNEKADIYLVRRSLSDFATEQKFAIRDLPIADSTSIMEFTPDGKELLIDTNEKSVFINPENGEILHQFDQVCRSVKDDADVIYCVGKEPGSIDFINKQSGEKIADLDMDDSGEIYRMFFSEDQKLFCLLSDMGSPVIYGVPE